MSRFIKCDMCQNMFTEKSGEVMQVTLKAERISLNIKEDDIVLEETVRDICKRCIIPIVVQFKEVFPKEGAN